MHLVIYHNQYEGKCQNAWRLVCKISSRHNTQRHAPPSTACAGQKRLIRLHWGEGAASCYYALCPVDAQTSNGVYQLCNSISDALQNTHPTLTATTFAAPTTTTHVPDVTTTKAPETTDATGATHTKPPGTTLAPETSISPNITYYHPSSTAEPSTTQSQATSSTSPMATAATNATIPADNDKGNSSVSSATVIGVSVASGVAGIFIVGVAVYYLCRRWRARRETRDFEIGGVMSEPSDFSHSRGPSPQPSPRFPPPDATRWQQEMSQNPHSPRVAAWVAQSPPTIKMVSEPNPARPLRNRDIGRAVGSDADWYSSPHTANSEHTLAELVPQSAGLYPKPLQWCRPESWQTVFEDENQPSKAANKGEYPPPQVYPQSTLDPQPRSLITGLPANPRAVKNGFPADKFRREPNQVPFGSPAPRGAAQDPGIKKLGSPFAGIAVRGSPSLVDTSGPKSSSGSSRGTPNLSNTTISSSSAQEVTVHRAPPGKGLPANPRPPRNSPQVGKEVVSRPRIVRGDDIRRIEPGDRSRPPSEVVAPYCPDDLWLERSRKIASRRESKELPYPCELTPGSLVYPSSPKKQPQNAAKRISSTSRNLTPSRRGNDLILSVD
ncbi:hypothetical protein N7470_002032 [Penicillium chermesinum]|nr:hypothetical protein N7470_002032 [Penicillium chermesinum]